MVEFIYVAGVDYPVYHAQPPGSKTQFQKRRYTSKFREYCIRRAHKTATTRKIKDARFTLFDFFGGSREEITFDSRGNVGFKVETTLGALNEADYRRCDTPRKSGARLTIPEPSLAFRTAPSDKPSIFLFPGVSSMRQDSPTIEDYRRFFADGAHKLERTMSVLDVYSYIMGEIGAKRPGTLSELHFFSHAVQDGPVLGNSLDRDGGVEARDPLDVDARPKDFLPAGPVGRATKDFSAAFALDGTCFLWGCEAFTFLRNMLNQTIRLASGAPSKSAKKIVFTWDDGWGESLATFHRVLGGVATTTKSEPWSIQEIDDEIAGRLTDGYSQHLANASGREVLAALPATYADFDTRGSKDDRLLHIPMGPTFGDKDNFQAILKFYKDQLTFDFDTRSGYSREFGRGYAIYNPGRTYRGKGTALPRQETQEQPV